MKRSREEDGDQVTSKRRALQYIQHKPAHMEPASQLPETAGLQLLRSITAACTLAGFDSVTPSALEMFRAQAEEYMLRFATQVRTSMQGQRRARPTPHDFSMALSHTRNTKTARELRGQLGIQLPKDVAYPSIPEPDPAPELPPDLSALLQPLLESRPPSWVPLHFPQRPAQHAWRSTEVWPERDKDARSMREKATEEGMLAEKALRRLAAAAKAGALKTEAKKRSETALAGTGKQRAMKQRPANEAIFGDVLQDVGGLEAVDQDVDDNAEQERREKIEAIEINEGLLVNSDAAHWRAGKRQGLAF